MWGSCEKFVQQKKKKPADYRTTWLWGDKALRSELQKQAVEERSRIIRHGVYIVLQPDPTHTAARSHYVLYSLVDGP